MAYLGQKGYSILKSDLGIEEQQWIRSELEVRPYAPNAPCQPPSFPIYRESAAKLYVPRFFGNEHFGVSAQVKLAQPEAAAFSFRGDLRDYQKKVVAAYMKSGDHHGKAGLLEIPCGRGKTVMALNIIAKLGTKTLVVVHKGFLMAQWEERIAQFLPGSRVGRIQGPVVDVKDKDIVIGMLQSLSMKTYPASLFSQFGLTVVDECHHISSEVFSRSLLKIVTRNTLGLSATMQRKDGLTKVFKMFIGPIVYSEKRGAGDEVLVKKITFTGGNQDEEYVETEYDYRGNPQYSRMISKLCAYGRRSHFVADTIQAEFSEKDGQQIMVLSQNRNLLVYLHNAIEHRGFATVGYYVGGMKDAELKNTESKEIILATYGMAAEALDIKTLTTLILATPRTDVTQAVGRILRVKHERPLVVDIVDVHQVFQTQWAKRQAFYRKNKYRIVSCHSGDYPPQAWAEEEVESTKAKKREPQGCQINLKHL